MTRSHLLPFLALIALSSALSGCSAENALMSKDTEASGASDTGDDDLTEVASVIRLDVYPSSSGPDLEPQSELIGLDAETTDLQIVLRSPITVRGEISGYLANPPSSIDVPGETIPVIAEVELTQEDDIAGAGTVSDAEGAFTLRVTPGADYVLAITPVDPSTIPFLVMPGLSLEEDQRLDDDLVELGDGVPVYGSVLRSDGVPVRTEVALEDQQTGIRGSVVETDETGYFLLRAMPGDYQLVVLGDTSRAVPSVSVPVAVAEEDGARVDIDLGAYDAVTFDCDVVDELGESVPNVPVRFTSIALADPDWSLQVETLTDNSGVLFTRLLPGTWSAEFIPSRDSGLSPVRRTFEVLADPEQEDAVVLPELTDLTGRVVNSQGAPLPGVVVTAREQGFDERTWSGTSDAEGEFDFVVPAVRLDLTFTPSTSGVAITRLENDPTSEQIGDVVMTEGVAVNGVLRTSDGAVVPYAVVELHDAATGDLLGTTLSGAEGGFSARVNP